MGNLLDILLTQIATPTKPSAAHTFLQILSVVNQVHNRSCAHSQQQHKWYNTILNMSFFACPNANSVQKSSERGQKDTFVPGQWTKRQSRWAIAKKLATTALFGL